jgi:phosphoglycerol geranylgeranyltransferase
MFAVKKDKMSIFKFIKDSKEHNKKLFAILIDPDKQNKDNLIDLVERANNSSVDLFFLGGSLLERDNLDSCLNILKTNSTIPIVLFPGNTMQINSKADAILFLSLISGRNAETLIGKQVEAAPILKQSNIEVLPTGYMLIDSGQSTTASYMSNSTPIPSNKNSIAACTAMAGEMLGLKLIFLDGGSGALNPVSSSMIKSVRNVVQAPIIVGGGISTVEKALENCNAGADIIVIGDAIEKQKKLIEQISNAIHNWR